MRILGIGGILVMLIGGITGRTVIGVLGHHLCAGWDASDEFSPLPPLQAGFAQADPAQNLPPCCKKPLD